MISLVVNNLAGNLEKDLVPPEMYKFSFKWVNYFINDHAILGLVDDPFPGRKPLYADLIQNKF